MPRRAAVAVAVVAALGAATWLADPFTLGAWSRTLSLGLLAASVAVLTGPAGLPSLGQVAPYAVGAYTTALLARAGVVTGPVQLVAAAGAAALFGAIVGVVVVRTRGIVFLMVTLAVAELTAIAADQLTITGGSDGLAGIPATRPWWGAAPLEDDRAVYAYTLAVALAALTVTWLVLRSPAGLLVRGIRDNEPRMRASGHPVTLHLLVTYVASSALAGLGGALLVTGQRYVSPQDVGFEVAALVLLAVTVGGAMSLAGAVAAVAVVESVRTWASVAAPGNGPLLLGLLFITAVYLVPDGLSGALTRIRRRLPARLS
jgi:branched-chain amino acid transport system permease protein